MKRGWEVNGLETARHGRGSRVLLMNGLITRADSEWQNRRDGPEKPVQNLGK
jgi:hypothetical protein